MSYVSAILPAASLFLAKVKRCRPQPFVWQPPGYVFVVAWTLLAATTGVSGVYIYNVNDHYSTTLFWATCWLLGNGWVLSNRICNQYFNFFYGALLLTVTCLLANHVAKSQDKHGKKARDWLIPLIVWECFAVLLYFSALWALVNK